MEFYFIAAVLFSLIAGLALWFRRAGGWGWWRCESVISLPCRFVFLFYGGTLSFCQWPFCLTARYGVTA